jgi:sugar/nucleoside kinase (ribokinase family)
MHPILVVGSVAFDTIHNNSGTHAKILGGSATYASLAASILSPVRLVGIVGRDYPEEAVRTMEARGIDLAGLERSEDLTFHWEGRYSDDLSSRASLCTELNAFADFHPKIPEAFRETPYVMLGNIAPELQLEVLDQVKDPKLVVADTMNFWIEGKRADLERVLTRVDVLVINEEEARQLSGKHHVVKVARELLQMGPPIVIVKQGEYGALLFHEDEVFSAPAYPVEEVRDPTGAGDTFAGGLLGYVALRDNVRHDTLRRAVIYGSAIASVCVEGVGVERLVTADRAALEERFRAFKKLAHFATEDEVAETERENGGGREARA